VEPCVNTLNLSWTIFTKFEAVENKNQPYLFGKKNVLFVLIGVALMIVGYLTMIGGGSEDPNVFPAEEMYGFRRTVLAPILIIAGLVMQIVAILIRPNRSSDHSD